MEISRSVIEGADNTLYEAKEMGKISAATYRARRCILPATPIARSLQRLELEK